MSKVNEGIKRIGMQIHAEFYNARVPEKQSLEFTERILTQINDLIKESKKTG